MTREDETRFLIGKLYTNLQSLEFVLRGALYEKASSPHNAMAHGTSINSFQTGDKLPENAMTDYSSLGQLIDRYNNEIANGDKTITVDKEAVDIRDALAHGRTSANAIDADYTLIKFDRPRNSLVNVVFAQKLTDAWLKEKIKFVYDETLKVIKGAGLKT